MLLSVQKRESTRKKDPKRLRRAGVIPAVLYGDKDNAHSLSIDCGAFQSHLRKITPGSLSTTIFTLKGEDGKETRAVVKDIQYHVVTYDILHLDFESLVAGEAISINIPVQLTGVVDCVGVKLGGVLRQALRYIRVKCKSENIPQAFVIDVKDLAAGESLKVTDVKVGPDVTVLSPLGEIVVMVAKK